MVNLNKIVPRCNSHKNKNDKNEHVITNIPDGLWNKISSLLPTEKPNKTIDRPVIPFRKVMEFIVRNSIQQAHTTTFVYSILL